MDDRQNRTNQLLMAIQPRLPSLDRDPLPERVFHYTNARGLLGILESGQIWATDYRYLNDSSEIKYIFDKAARISEGLLSTWAGEELGRAFLEYAATESPPYSETVYYLCCFSEVDNSLSQWRAYGGRDGYSLAVPGDVTFRRGAEEVAGRQGQTAGITLGKVLYDEAFHDSYVRTLISLILEMCGSEHMRSYPSTAEALPHFTPFFWGQLERASYRFKHPDFADEREWRLVMWLDLDRIPSSATVEFPERFRVGETLTPYTTFSLYSAGHPSPRVDKLPLLSVRYGPTPRPAETSIALNRALVAHGYPADFCQRLGSQTPARL